MGFEFVVWIIIGFTFGVAVSLLVGRSHKPETDGVLRIDRSDLDGPFMFLEVSKSVNELSAKECVMFIVKDENYISQQ